MREIKFRAWVKQEKRMLFWEEIYDIARYCLTKEEEGIAVHVAEGDQYYLLPDEFELMQFTGLKDKNGKEIYEGDIVSFFSLLNSNKMPDDEDIGKITFECTAFWIKGIAMHCFLPEQLNVIGNIFENSELLK